MEEEKELIENMKKAAEQRRISCLIELDRAHKMILQKYHCKMDFSINIHQDGTIQPILNVIPMPIPANEVGNNNDVHKVDLGNTIIK